MNFKFYRVYQNDTEVTMISCNDFKTPSHSLSKSDRIFSLLPVQERYRAYRNLVDALEQAKAGAIAYINMLISQGAAGRQELLQYRIDHYEDLNVNLLDRNIRKIEQDIQLDEQYKWQPYRIQYPAE